MVSITEGLVIGIDDTRIGVVTYGEDASIELRLSDTDTEANVASSILSMVFKDGQSNIAAGINRANSGRIASVPTTLKLK